MLSTGLSTIKERGMTVRDVEELMDSTNVKGFPVISVPLPEGSQEHSGHTSFNTNTSSKPVLIGYIGRTELRLVLGSSSSDPSFIVRIDECLN